MTRCLLAAVTLVAGVTVGHAADRIILGKSLLVNDPHASEPGRSVIVVGAEKPTDVPALSDPTAGGATLTVIANGGSPSSQSYVLDASGWSALGTMGFKYAGPTGADGDPVRQVVIKRTATFARIKVVVRGNVGTQPVDVVPPNPGTDGGIILDVAGGDRYCVGFSGGSSKRNTAQSWKVVRPVEAGCPVAATTTTTTTSTTTTRPPPGCGNGFVDPGEQCDGNAFSDACFEGSSNGFVCGAPAAPDACKCCGTQHCIPSQNVPCCPGFTCVDAPGLMDDCEPCVPLGQICFRPAEEPSPHTCCAGQCTKVISTPTGPAGVCCLPTGASCTSGTDCCNDSCNGGGTCD